MNLGHKEDHMDTIKLEIPFSGTHACGANISASQKFCGGCGKKLFSQVRSENEIKAMVEAFLDAAQKAEHLPQSLVAVYAAAVTITTHWVRGGEIAPDILLKRDSLGKIVDLGHQ